MRYIQYASLRRHISPAANIPTPRPSQQATRAQVWYAKRIRRTKFAAPLLLSSVNVMQLCCITFTEAYRSGHNEAVLKTVWGQPHGGSNPSASANKNRTFVYQDKCSVFVYPSRKLGISSRRSRVYHQGRLADLVSHHAPACILPAA